MPPKNTTQNINTLSDIARGMQHAVNTTQEIIEQHYIRLLDRYFDENGNPLMAVFNLTPDHVVQAPLISLVPPSALALEELTIEMSVEIRGASVKPVDTISKNLDLTRTSFSVAFASGSRQPVAHSEENADEPKNNNGNVIGITMKFKRGDTPEGVARVLDEFNKTVIMKPQEASKEVNPRIKNSPRPLKRPKK
jgi:hypothetical protein